MNKSQNHQVIRPIGKPLTDEEKKRMVIKELMDKRERFALNILCNLCRAAADARAVVKADLHSTELTIDTDGLVEKSVSMADALLEKLYPLNEEKAE